jgi:hypothetical protein
MKKKQLHEALPVLLTKLSSARDNPLLMDNYAVKTLRTVLLEFKESGELYDASIKESMTDEAIEGMVNSMLGE